MLKATLRFAETAILVVAIVGIYGFTFVTVFSLNPKTDLNTSAQTDSSVLGAVDMESTSFQRVSNVSQDLDFFKTNLEKLSGSNYVYNITFLSNYSVDAKDILLVTNDSPEAVDVKYVVEAVNFDLLGMGIEIAGDKVFLDTNDVEFKFESNLVNADIIKVSLNPQFPDIETPFWITVKLHVQL